MINRLGVIFLTVCCVALIVVLVVMTKNATTQHEKDVSLISSVSNSLNVVKGQLSSQQQTNSTLVKVIATKEKAFEETVVMLTNRNNALGEDLQKAEASLKAAKDLLAQRDAKIADLESQNLSLNERAAELSAAITDRETQIADTKKKLETAEGDKTFLQGELKRLMAEKADLQREFNDVNIVRQQFAKLKEEQGISRRLDWMNRGILAGSEKKGGERLMQLNTEPTFSTSTNAAAPAKTSPPKPNHYDLNVEVNSDGSVRVIPPSNNPPPKSP